MIENLRLLEKKSTPAPWAANILAGRFHVIVNREKVASMYDFDLIDAMRNALPKFIALYDAAKKLNCEQGSDCLGYGFLDVEQAIEDLEKNEP